MSPDLKTCFKNAIHAVHYGADTASFSASSTPTEDRLIVEEWNLHDGPWKFMAIFDGMLK